MNHFIVLNTVIRNEMYSDIHMDPVPTELTTFNGNFVYRVPEFRNKTISTSIQGPFVTTF